MRSNYKILKGVVYMTYAVEKAKGSKEVIVLDTRLDINERWVFEPYLLGIQPNKEGDIILPFLEYLIDNYPSVKIDRDSIIDSKRVCFTGMSTLVISFTDKDEAQSYANALNNSTKRK